MEWSVFFLELIASSRQDDINHNQLVVFAVDMVIYFMNMDEVFINSPSVIQ